MTSYDPVELSARVGALLPELVAFRRDLHAHPETARNEVRTTERVAQRLKDAGLEPELLPGTGLVCDLGAGTGPAVALRADLDALPVADVSGLSYASAVEGVAHACGHDVHTAVVLGAGLVLADLAAQGELAHRVRLVFQPAEETMPGGALDVVAAGALDGVGSIYALHCDPHLDVGHVGVRVGPITSASDHVFIRLTGSGGHTSRPHLTGDLVYALGQVVTQVPAILGRRVDPRAGVNVTWGRVSAGSAPNAIPRTGLLEGTLRCLDTDAWEHAGAILKEVVADVVRPYAVSSEVTLRRGVPPVENDASAVEVLETAARAVLGHAACVPTEQSLGGEDFAWYVHRVPGAMGRLGTRTPGGRTYDLHQGDFAVDESCIGVGVRLLAAVAAAGPYPPEG